ncbi:hypothetical protein [Streptococcus cuniculipharyngis]|uniref:MORN repeat protein n=1 Tax=Streptococcus cuniculipharyngis TaxID=1562651 RepID=A0A5C5SC34_9STRE|nr:hypothetical protein [Streptococcus cuniculipharyngis]TWS97167.1 hypothetical protein FRX57_06110 [Streptococcus cuniculipharyngis]
MRGQKISRVMTEVLACIIILVLGASVFFVPIKRQATLSYDNGRLSYSGQVVNQRLNGQGKLTYDNGDVYEGQFINGVFNGQGKFIAATGWQYEGQFKNGQPDGQGTLIAKDKKVYKGTFKQGIYQK